MNKHLIILIGLFSFCSISFGQASNSRMLFVIDSIPVETDPEEWNEILPDDIADIRVVINDGTLRLAGIAKFDSVTYIFTKEYRNRPDSIKQVPSLKQMKLNDAVWTLNGIPYSGTYIDYYNSGRKLDEGSLLNGRLNGELKVYFQNGNIKSAANYKDGIFDGAWIEYYKSGVLKQKREYVKGNTIGVWESYFPDGQVEFRNTLKKRTPLDTSIVYYSTGKVKRMTIFKNGVAIKNPVLEKINFLQNKVYETVRNKDAKNAMKYCDKIIKLNSLNETAHFYLGEILVQGFHFDEAIEEYDKALQIEPLFKAALINRAFARIKKYEFINNKWVQNHNKPVVSTSTTPLPIPKEEQEKICNDLQRAVFTDASGKMIDQAISNYCQTKSNH